MGVGGECENQYDQNDLSNTEKYAVFLFLMYFGHGKEFLKYY